jgi:hypothetical protein
LKCKKCHGDKNTANNRAKTQGAKAKELHEKYANDPLLSGVYLKAFAKDPVTGRRPDNVNIEEVTASIERKQSQETWNDSQWKGEFAFKKHLKTELGWSQERADAKWKASIQEKKWDRNSGEYELKAKVFLDEQDHRADGISVGHQFKRELSGDEAKSVINSGIFKGPNMKLDMFTDAAADALSQLGIVGVGRPSKADTEDSPEGNGKKKRRKVKQVVLEIPWYCFAVGSSDCVPLVSGQSELLRLLFRLV